MILTFLVNAAVYGGIGAVIGIFVYRNNASLLDKYADKVDTKFDELKAEIEKLKAKK